MQPSEPASIRFTAHAVPVAQPRQRHRVIAAGGRNFVQNYTPADDPVNSFKSSLRDAAAAVYRAAPLAGPIRLRCVFVFPRPQSMMWKKRPTPRARHVGRPDADNVLKAVKDALSKILWRDDSQVCDLSAVKWIAAGDEQPHVDVAIEEIVDAAEDLVVGPASGGLFL